MHTHRCTVSIIIREYKNRPLYRSREERQVFVAGRARALATLKQDAESLLSRALFLFLFALFQPIYQRENMGRPSIYADTLYYVKTFSPSSAAFSAVAVVARRKALEERFYWRKKRGQHTKKEEEGKRIKKENPEEVELGSSK